MAYLECDAGGSHQRDQMDKLHDDPNAEECKCR